MNNIRQLNDDVFITCALFVVGSSAENNKNEKSYQRLLIIMSFCLRISTKSRHNSFRSRNAVDFEFKNI